MEIGGVRVGLAEFLAKSSLPLIPGDFVDLDVDGNLTGCPANVVTTFQALNGRMSFRISTP